ncbi:MULTISPECIES: hypothetical protein [unclassified Mesorhizobium]|uniref:hypothetical protein n=1 Tax=unclassified Mesorhizobium TaxID=325217 RepID=UPI0012EADEB4|nr:MULTISPECIES: hypothetical protein [unclassified Mesorhizobium]
MFWPEAVADRRQSSFLTTAVEAAGRGTHARIDRRLECPAVMLAIEGKFGLLAEF